MAFEIDISCDHDSAAVDCGHDSTIVDCDSIQAALVSALEQEEVRTAVLSVTLVDNPTMHRLNREHLQHDYPTDVISFPLEWMCGDESLEDRAGFAEGRAKDALIEGEIVVSVDYAQEMAKRCGWTTQNELTLYAVHGMLHICGYDDLTPDEKQLMRLREKAILGHLGIKVTYPDDATFDDDEPPGKSSGSCDASSVETPNS